MYRLGAHVDKRDRKGNTALSLALDVWCLALRTCVPKLYANYPDAYFARMRHIVHALLKQHADVDMKVNGKTSLHRACELGDWGIISAVLEYGASLYPPRDPENNIPPPATFLSPVDRNRLRRVAYRYEKKPRPSRLCPCYSGKTLANCHALVVDNNYPGYFRCICGSGKAHSACSCSRRDTCIVEHYEEELGRIVARFGRDVPFDPRLIPDVKLGKHPLMNATFRIMEDMATLLDVERPNDAESREFHEKGMAKVREMAVELTLKGMVDPAYTYALYRADRCPR